MHYSSEIVAGARVWFVHPWQSQWSDGKMECGPIWEDSMILSGYGSLYGAQKDLINFALFILYWVNFVTAMLHW